MTSPVVHWKPVWRRLDGAACGKLRVPFTGERAAVTCKRCLKLGVARLPRGEYEDGAAAVEPPGP